MTKMGTKKILIAVLAFLAAIIAVAGAVLMGLSAQEGNQEAKGTQESIETYNPQINSADFTTKIDNKYLTLIPGTKHIYEGKTEKGIERTEVYITNNRRMVMGVEVVEVSDRVFLDDELIEDTKDWYAQDKYGNVWYFGEDSKEIVNGKIASTAGSWVAGFYGAKPGIVMKANPQAGDVYRQEYYPGQAEDMGQVVALGVKIKVKHGSFSGCLQTKDWNPLEPEDEEYKYYCPEAQGLVYEAGIEDKESSQLVSIEKDSYEKQAEAKKPAEYLKRDITEQEAKEIALKTAGGRVTDIDIEKKFGKAAYVVEIDDGDGEVDVIIDLDTGAVLGTER